MGLADLKRKLIKGTALKMIYNSFGKSNLIGVKRYVVKTNTKGVYLNLNPNEDKGSLLEYPRNSLLELTEKGFKIYEAGYRDLNEKEKTILEHIPKDEKQQEIDLISDTNVMYYRKKMYLEQSGYAYLIGAHEKEGLYYDINTNKIRDSNIKGDLDLEYEFI